MRCSSLDVEIDARKYGLKRAYDATHHEVEIALGSLVLVHQTARRPGVKPKLRKHYDGPYRVLEKMSPVTYQLQHVHKGRTTIIHVQRIVPYYERQETGADDGSNDSEDDDLHDSDGDEDVSVTRDTPLAMPQEHVKASDMYAPFRAHGGRLVEIVGGPSRYERSSSNRRTKPARFRQE